MTERKTLGRGDDTVAPVGELFPPQGQWTESDYFALPETSRFVELSGGNLIVPPHPTHTHQTLVLELATRLRDFLKRGGLGEVGLGPLPIRLWPGKIREPDIFFFSNEHLDRIGEQSCGVPDLVVEVLAPGTKEVDRGQKFYEYANAGVREYWLVDPEARSIKIYVLETGAYELTDKFRPGETVCSVVLAGLNFPVDEVFGR